MAKGSDARECGVRRPAGPRTPRGIAGSYSLTLSRPLRGAKSAASDGLSTMATMPPGRIERAEQAAIRADHAGNTAGGVDHGREATAAADQGEEPAGDVEDRRRPAGRINHAENRARGVDEPGQPAPDQDPAKQAAATLETGQTEPAPPMA